MTSFLGNQPFDRTMKFIEFLGASGVGKSVVSGAVVKLLQERNLPVTDGYDGIKSRYSLKTFIALAKAAYVVARIRPKLLLVYPHSIRALAKHELHRRQVEREGGIYIASEAFFQRLRDLDRRTEKLRMEELADIVFSVFQAPDIVVVLEADQSTISDRRTGRARPGETWTHESVAKDVIRTGLGVRAIRHTKRRISPNLCMIQIDVSDKSIESLASEIAGKIESRLHQLSDV